jgi:hypothetical protein
MSHRRQATDSMTGTELGLSLPKRSAFQNAHCKSGNKVDVRHLAQRKPAALSNDTPSVNDEAIDDSD